MTGKKAEKTGWTKRSRLRWGAVILLALAAGALAAKGGLIGPGARVADGAPQGSEVTRSAAPTEPPADAPGRADARSAREAAYDKDVATLERLIANEGADEAARAQAAERLQRMVGEHQSELGVEEALRGAGFTPCYALMQNGSLTVMVALPDLTATQSAAILSLCVAHADVGVENVRIMTGQALE